MPMDKCLGFCPGLPVGTSADKSGDTLGCRIYHAGLAASDPTTHCPHAGPTGGDISPTGTAGVCGEPCPAFCAVALQVCNGMNGVPQTFPDMNTCMTACQGFAADTAPYNDTDTTKNDLFCRVYHLTNAAASTSAAVTHCPHIATVSSACSQ
jgi:hypothetical protein